MKEFKPMNIEEFNRKPGKANCMLFAFGKKIDPKESTYDYNLFGLYYKPIEDVVEEKIAIKFGIKLQHISSLGEAPEGKYIIGVYVKAPKDEYGEFDYHFIRRELDGTWVEKATWKNEDIAEHANLEDLRIEFGADPTYFVVEGVL